jgi:predicted signal transduction protein with EAL and GGDEF domain
VAWWQASALFNGIIAVCYLGIVWNIVKGLRDSRQLLSNSLALSTAGIFFTCAVHHGSHTIHMLLPYAGLGTPDGLAMRQAFGSHMTLWDLVGAAVAVYYLSLRRSYGRLLASPQMFEDRVREQSERKLRQQAFADELTGLPNRSAFREHMAQLASVDGDGCTLLFLDLDRFKLVNDTLGHDVGDQLLRAVAARLHEALSPGQRLFRLGGDEFTVVAADRWA